MILLSTLSDLLPLALVLPALIGLARLAYGGTAD
ncbi:hypothetical protein AJ62_02643 [Pseudomonas aeruginosa 3575]|nr:hypothetical protein AJ62_02643 [Pseudomonas aeruginosa 3575]